MLEPYIIEELKRRDAERRKKDEQPRIELPVPPPQPHEPAERKPPKEDQPDGGVVIIDL